MAEAEFLFTTKLHEKLKEVIIGSVFVRVVYGDKLYIKIESLGGIVFSLYIEDFSPKIRNGLTTDDVAHEVVSKYKKYVLNKFFN